MPRYQLRNTPVHRLALTGYKVNYLPVNLGDWARQVSAKHANTTWQRRIFHGLLKIQKRNG